LEISSSWRQSLGSVVSCPSYSATVFSIINDHLGTGSFLNYYPTVRFFML
jgi:hypothetical protein